MSEPVVYFKASAYRMIFSGDATRFDSQVSELLRDGWQLHGPTIVIQPEKYPRFYQAMVRP